MDGQAQHDPRTLGAGRSARCGMDVGIDRRSPRGAMAFPTCGRTPQSHDMKSAHSWWIGSRRDPLPMLPAHPKWRGVILTPEGRGSILEMAQPSPAAEAARVEQRATRAVAHFRHPQIASRSTAGCARPSRETGSGEIRPAHPTGSSQAGASLPLVPTIPAGSTPSTSIPAGSHAGASDSHRAAPLIDSQAVGPWVNACELRVDVSDCGNVSAHAVHPDARAPHLPPHGDATVPASPARHRVPQPATHRSTSVLAGCRKAR